MLKFFISAISRALGFSKTEARGTLLLIFIIIISITLSQLYISNLKFKHITSIVNTSDLDEWIETVKSSYNVKRGKEEFDKSVYFSTKKKFNSKPFVANTKNPTNNERNKIEEKIVIKDLNNAIAPELRKVKGIGPVYAQRIVKYRNRLGGFASSEQLKEIYGLKDETIDAMLKYFDVLSPVEKININADSATVLARHPYISYDLAWVIINYRKQNGDIVSSKDLRRIKAIDELTFTRLKPYID